jgi:ABC-type nitrate/sulfonate/bicarbonate transport system substrate-binding protein
VLKRAAVLAGLIVVLAAGCSSPAKPKPLPPPTGVLRLGFTTGLADAPVLAGLQMGYISAGLGAVTLDPVPFPTTAAEALALQRGQVDAAYLDPMAAVAVWQSAGQARIKIIAGVASGGAELVVRSGITKASQLAPGPGGGAACERSGSRSALVAEAEQHGGQWAGERDDVRRVPGRCAEVGAAGRGVGACPAGR